MKACARSFLLFLGSVQYIYSSSHAHLRATQETNQRHFFNFIVRFLVMPFFDCLEPMDYCPCFGFRKGKKYRGSDSMQKLQPSGTFTDPELPSGSKPEVSVAVDGLEANKTRTFTFRELATATNNFRQDSLIGEGGFGTVYKGKIEGVDQVVAVKMLNKNGLQGNKEFLVEVLMLSLLCHPNLVSMIGYCAEGDQRLLVYEFMPLGSLERHLHDLPPDKEPLDWNTRMKIACGAAKGLGYLHHEAQPPVIFRDLKSSNILLDEGFYPKLSDFGFAKFGPAEDRSHVSTRVMGTHGYCAPEYATTGKLTMKSDTYSFGVVLLELITGQLALDPTRGHGKKMLVDRVLPMLKDPKNYSCLADPRLKGHFPESALHHALELASMCLRENANARPLMKEVVIALDYLVAHPYDPNADKDSRKRGVRASENEADLKGTEKDSRRTEVGKKLNTTIDREQAVAEAKKWGESWRDMKEKGQSSSCNS